MANMIAVNKALKSAYPSLDVEAVRGAGYVYFDGDDGFGKVESIMVNPASTATAALIEICIEEISRSVAL